MIKFFHSKIKGLKSLQQDTYTKRVVKKLNDTKMNFGLQRLYDYLPKREEGYSLFKE
jgi:hypothetical protein